MVKFKELYKLPYISKRMYIIKRICSEWSVEVEYLFGLFNLFNSRNGGRWFWQRASFTGTLKKAFDAFNSSVDNIVKDLKYADEKKTGDQVTAATKDLDKLLTGMEMNCEVNRDTDASMVKGHLDKNLGALIKDSLKRTNIEPD